MSHLRTLSLSVVVVLGVVACVGSSDPADPSGSPSGPPATDGSAPPVSPSPVDFGTVEHATGATDVLLRYDLGGGFVQPSFTASQTPIFTLYGDGTVIFRNQALEGPPPEGSVFPQNPLRTAKLSEEQIQEVLVFALGEGSLGIARAQYDHDGVADAGTATFTIDAGGIKKTVAVYALGIDVLDGSADGPIRASFERLAERLADFDKGGTVQTDVYLPMAYRGVLMDGTGFDGSNVIAWPWTDIQPADFAGPGDPNAFMLATHTLTPADVALLGVSHPEGGFQGLVIDGPANDIRYSFALRPLLPDETE